MNNFKKIIEDKKLKSSQVRPRYGMRKLSVGLVSCTLGFIIFAGPNVVNASENSLAPSEVVEEKSADQESPLDQPAEVEERKDEAIDSKPVEANQANKVDTELAEEASKAKETSPAIEERAESLEVSPETQAPQLKAAANEANKSDGVAKDDKGNDITKDSGSIAADEKNVGNYRDSDLANNGAKKKIIWEENGKEVEGVTATVTEPSSSSTDKRTLGLTIEIDKEKSQRTYTEVGSTSTRRGAPVLRGEGNLSVSIGEEKQANPSEDVYAEVTGKSQTQFDLDANKKFLEKLNNKDNKTGKIEWTTEYTQDNPNNKLFEGNGNYESRFSVNPYPNENKNLSIISVVGETGINSVPVKGQYIKTKARIENLLPEDYTRITSEVYHPDGQVVDPKYAKAILITPDNKESILDELKKFDPNATLTEGDIVFKMPEGAIMNDPEAEAKGEYKPVLNPNSIFNDPVFKGIQSLTARFFARPRTQKEFEAIVDQDNPYGTKHYTATGAGTKGITHNGTYLEIDKQGIARYDYYNNIGNITLNLDDTRFYDQNWDQKFEKDGDKMTSIKPGQEKKIEIKKENEDKYPYEKTASEMNEARNDGRVSGKVDPEFIKKAEADGWKIEITPGDLSSFKVTAPKGAKAGDFIAIPMTYTYTNGSEDSEWFHFVVQESDNNRPEYHAKAGYQGDSLVNTPTIPEDEAAKKKNQPTSYELKPGTYKDDRGNVWATVTQNPTTGEITADNVTIDKDTGKITVKVPEGIDIVGGENLYIPVIAKYDIKDEQGKITETKTEEVKAQFIARPKYETTVVHEYEKDIPFETKEELDENLEAGKIEIVTPGTVGKSKFKFTQVVQNGVKGIINDQGEFEAGDDKFALAEEIVTPKVDRLVKVGVKPVEERITIPHTIEYIVDPNLKPGQEEVIEEGIDGEIKFTTSRDPQTGATKLDKKTVWEMQPMKVKIGVYNHTNKEPFETKIEFDDTKAAGTQETVTEGVVGETETKVTPAKIADMDDMMKTIGEDNFRDDKNNPNYDAIEKYMVEKGYWEKGKVQKTTDQDGKITASYNGQNIDALLGMDEKNNPAGKVLVPGRVETSTIKEKQDKVIKVGTMTEGKVVDEDKIPFGIRVEYDPNLKKGEWKYKEIDGVKQEGVAGSNKKTWTIKNSQVVGKPEITQTLPKDAVILVGNQDFTGDITHKEKVEIPFKTEYIYDENLEAGKTEIVNEGQAGSKDITYTQKIKNGSTDGEMTSKESNKVDPQNRVIKIGTKAVTKEIEKPFETEYVYNDNLDSGSVNEKQVGKNGKVTISTSYDKENKKLINKETEEKATNRIIEIGTKPIVKEVEVPYNTTYEIDPEMEPGTEKVVTEGVEGKKTITTTFDKDQKKLVVKENDQAPTNKHVKIGAKTEGNVTYTEEVPYEVEVVLDDTLAAGEKVESGGIKGERTVTVKVKNSQKVGDPAYEVTKQAVKKIIRVGTLCKLPPTPGEDPVDPSKPVDPSNPGTNQGGNTPGGNPGGNIPGDNTPGGKTPGTDPANPNPTSPNKGTENPGKIPGKVDGNPGLQEKPGLENGEKPFEAENKDSNQISEEESKQGLTDKKEIESQKENKASKENTENSVEKSKDQAKRLQVKDPSKQDHSRSPQTFDAGIGSYLGLGALTSSALAFLEIKKRKKDDE